MRLPFPERISMIHAAAFAAVLFVVEQLEGTDPYYSTCVLLFILIATFGFNAAGGFAHASGAYVFFYATIGCILGWTTKALLGEPGDSNLLQPNLTASVFLGGITSLTFAVILVRRLAWKRPLLQNILRHEDYAVASAGCAIIGCTIIILTQFIPFPDGSFLAAIRQFRELVPLAIILGVLSEIRKTDGRRSVNAVVLLAAGTNFLILGIVVFSKEGMFAPIVSYLVAASCMRFRFSILQLVAGAAVILWISMYLVPYSQYGRNLKSPEKDASMNRFTTDTATALSLLSNLGDVKNQYQATAFESAELGLTGFYNQDESLLDRLQMIYIDDKLIDATVQGKSSFGYTPIVSSILNGVPHFLWPEKPDLDFGNLYAHEVGGIIDDADVTTGISFSPSAQAYHISGWFGVFILAPVVWFCCFFVVESLCGDTRVSPWGLAFVVFYSHAAPEGMLTSVIDSVVRHTPDLILTALLCAYVMPLLAGLLGRKRSQSSPAAVPSAAPSV